VAEQIGFPAGNPFQWELGWASLGLGVISLIGVWRADFWWPSAISAAVFLWGAAWGHVYQMVVNGNHHTGNSGPILYVDLAVPLAVLVLLVVRVSIGTRSAAEQPAQRTVARPAGQQG
jgi:peptidoglycan/LPS O-acetylase OafA/YrhL